MKFNIQLTGFTERQAHRFFMKFSDFLEIMNFQFKRSFDEVHENKAIYFVGDYLIRKESKLFNLDFLTFFLSKITSANCLEINYMVFDQDYKLLKNKVVKESKKIAQVHICQ